MIFIKSEPKSQTSDPICPFCHDRVALSESLIQCGDCNARHHSECWRELKKCSTCSGSKAMVRKSDKKAQKRKNKRAPKRKRRIIPRTPDSNDDMTDVNKDTVLWQFLTSSEVLLIFGGIIVVTWCLATLFNNMHFTSSRAIQAMPYFIGLGIAAFAMSAKDRS